MELLSKTRQHTQIQSFIQTCRCNPMGTFPQQMPPGNGNSTLYSSWIPKCCATVPPKRSSFSKTKGIFLLSSHKARGPTKRIIKCQDSDSHVGRKCNISLQMCISRSKRTQLYTKNQNYSEVATELIWLSYLTVEGEAVSQHLPLTIQHLFVNF